MEELYLICNHYYSELLKKDDISLIDKIGLSQEEKRIEDLLGKINDQLLNGSYDMTWLLKYCRVGKIYHLDFLAWLLSGINYPNYLHGVSYNQELKDYYSSACNEIMLLVTKLIGINVMLNNLVLFVRRHYDLNFLDYLDESKEGVSDINKLIFEMQLLERKMLCNKNIFIKDIPKDGLVSLLKSDLKERNDSISMIIDRHDYDKMCGLEWQFIKDELIKVRDDMVNTRHLSELSGSLVDLHLNFLDDLIVYIDRRINYLVDGKVLKKVLRMNNGEGR